VKKMIITILLIGLTTALMAQSHESHEAVSAEDVFRIVPSLDGKAVSEITINEVLEIAESASVVKQEQHYIRGAAMSSLLIPGMGQFKTGNTLGGVLHMTTGLAIAGGSIYGSYMLLSEDVKAILGDKTAMHSYFETNDKTEMLPAFGVMAGGGVLYLINNIISSGTAVKRAKAQVESGDVTFEPDLYIVSGGFGFGMHMRM